MGIVTRRSCRFSARSEPHFTVRESPVDVYNTNRFEAHLQPQLTIVLLV